MSCLAKHEHCADGGWGDVARRHAVHGGGRVCPGRHTGGHALPAVRRVLRPRSPPLDPQE